MKKDYIKPVAEVIAMRLEPIMGGGSPATQTTDKTTGTTSTGEGDAPQIGGDSDGDDMGAKHATVYDWSSWD